MPALARPISVREFRQRYASFAVVGLVLACTVVLWRKQSGHTVFVGQAEAVRTVVSATKPGTVIAVHADLLQRVKRGEVLAQIVPADLDATCAELASKVETLRAELLQSSDRSAVNYQSLRLDLLRRNVDLASANVERQLAESEFQRYRALHETHMVSDAEFETRRTNRDALQSKVDALTKLTADLANEIAHLRPDAANENDPVARAISAAMVAQQKQLEALSEASNLKAPTDGIVSLVQKHAGENLAAGEPVITLGALRATRIVAYARQPLATRPKPGDLVQVSTRSGERASAPARVLEVGTQLEAIEPALLPPTSFSAKLTEYGLPLLVEIPAGLNIAPGEIVNLTAPATN